MNGLSNNNILMLSSLYFAKGIQLVARDLVEDNFALSTDPVPGGGVVLQQPRLQVPHRLQAELVRVRVLLRLDSIKGIGSRVEFFLKVYNIK
jgi:hypothetical protein